MKTKYQILKALNLTEAELSRVLGISQQAVNKCGVYLPDGRVWQLSAMYPDKIKPPIKIKRRG